MLVFFKICNVQFKCKNNLFQKSDGNNHLKLKIAHKLRVNIYLNNNTTYKYFYFNTIYLNKLYYTLSKYTLSLLCNKEVFTWFHDKNHKTWQFQYALIFKKKIVDV